MTTVRTDSSRSPPSSTIACLIDSPFLYRAAVMSESIPDIRGSVGCILRVEHPISGARFSIDSMHSALEKTESRLLVEEMRSSVDLTILLSTFAARPMAASVSSMSPQ